MKDTGISKPAANEPFTAVASTAFTANETAPAPEGTDPSPEERDVSPGETKPSPEGTMGEASLPLAHPGEKKGEAPVSPAPPEGTRGERLVIKGATFALKASSGEKPGESFKTKGAAYERKVEDFVSPGGGFNTKGEGTFPFASFRRTKGKGNGRKASAGGRMAANAQSSGIISATPGAATNPNHLLPLVRVPARSSDMILP